MKPRLNLAISQSVKDRMENLKDQIGADSLTEVVRRAIDVLELVVKEQKEGNFIQISKKDEPPMRIYLNL